MGMDEGRQRVGWMVDEGRRRPDRGSEPNGVSGARSPWRTGRFTRITVDAEIRETTMELEWRWWEHGDGGRCGSVMVGD